ncbi:MAG: YHS domain-containing (seleno)protein [Acidobacteriota bacterium]
MHRFTAILGLFLMLTVLAAPAMAAKKPINQTTFGGVAIKGYDPVAYFTDSQAVKGDKQHTFSWQGANWHFASAENRDTFAADPEAYAPQYGGYCAYAVSKGNVAGIDPEAWTVHEGKLYLNYSIGVMNKWREDIPGNIAKADANWPGVLD